jgi:hypothetical protein
MHVGRAGYQHADTAVATITSALELWNRLRSAAIAAVPTPATVRSGTRLHHDPCATAVNHAIATAATAAASSEVRTRQVRRIAAPVAAPTTTAAIHRARYDSGHLPRYMPSAPPPPPPPPPAVNQSMSKFPSPPLLPPLWPGALPDTPQRLRNRLPCTDTAGAARSIGPAAAAAGAVAGAVGHKRSVLACAEGTRPARYGKLYPPAPPLPPTASAGGAAKDIVRRETAPATARRRGFSTGETLERFVMRICSRQGRRPFSLRGSQRLAGNARAIIFERGGSVRSLA